jgi:4-hydroxy-tetrahydrodipicolinate synthase
MATTGRLTGILPVLATPLTAGDHVDEEGLRRLIRHVGQADNAGLVVCGSMGEFAALTYEQRQRAIEIAVDEVHGRVPIIAGTGDSGTTKAVLNTKGAESLGADYALVTLPYYYGADRQAALAHYRQLLDETGIPILIYNIPMFAHVAVDSDVVGELAAHERMAGIKDAGGDFPYFQRVVRETRDREQFSVIQGWDSLVYAGLLCGGHGAIVWASNLVPDLPVHLYEAVQAGRLEEARELQWKLLQLGAVMERRKSLQASLKAALSLLGICDATVSRGISHLTRQEMTELERDLKELGIL